MEEKLKKCVSEAFESFDNDMDVLIIAHKNGKCSATINGDESEVAKSIFALMHDRESYMAPKLALIMKLIVKNTLANQSPWAVDLMKSINDLMSEDDE